MPEGDLQHCQWISNDIAETQGAETGVAGVFNCGKLSWEKAEAAVLNRQGWRRSVARCTHVHVG